MTRVHLCTCNGESSRLAGTEVLQLILCQVRIRVSGLWDTTVLRDRQQTSLCVTEFNVASSISGKLPNSLPGEKET